MGDQRIVKTDIGWLVECKWHSLITHGAAILSCPHAITFTSTRNLANQFCLHYDMDPDNPRPFGTLAHIVFMMETF